MIEVVGDLWTYPADVRVITTNGTVKKNGECVMGRGCAAEAKQKWPGIALGLGNLIRQHGNVPFCLFSPQNDGDKFALWSFPVKHAWYDKADIVLIQKSAKLLRAECCAYADDWLDRDAVIVMPRPGCGNGHLDWNTVKLVLAPILDDRFHVITWR